MSPRPVALRRKQGTFVFSQSSRGRVRVCILAAFEFPSRFVFIRSEERGVSLGKARPAPQRRRGRDGRRRDRCRPRGELAHGLGPGTARSQRPEAAQRSAAPASGGCAGSASSRTELVWPLSTLRRWLFVLVWSLEELCPASTFYIDLQGPPPFSFTLAFSNNY